MIEYLILLRAGTLETKGTSSSRPVLRRDETSLPSQTHITVLALGGNAILQRNQEGTFEEQYENVRSTATQIVTLVGQKPKVSSGTSYNNVSKTNYRSVEVTKQ